MTGTHLLIMVSEHPGQALVIKDYYMHSKQHLRLPAGPDAVATRATAVKLGPFEEVPGEAEADAVRDAFLRHANSSRGGTVEAMAAAGPGTLPRVVTRLQAERGNAHVQRVVEGLRGSRGRLVGLSQAEMVAEVSRRKGAGLPLPDDTRKTMEGFFGVGLGHVRVHDNGPAVQLSRELNARAFAVGPDVFFAPGQYAPVSREGQGLLAHELTHVLQQARPGGVAAQRSPLVQRDAEAAEEEGDSASESAPSVDEIEPAHEESSDNN